MENSQAIKEYAISRSDESFKALVDQYVGLVYSACLRHLKDRHLAEDAAQAVFLLLSQKAGSLTQRRLSGWLLTTSRYACANIRKKEQRRQSREQVAAMNPNTETNSRKDDLHDLLNEALCHLKAVDREALVLCFLKEQPLSDVAERLGVSQDAARKRVDRGIEKLRQYFCRRGITTTSAALSSLLTEQVSGAVLTIADRNSIARGILQVCRAGPNGAAPSVAIAKGTQSMMFIAKLKTVAVVVIIAAIIAALGTAGWIASTALAENAAAPNADTPVPAATPVAADNAPASTKPSARYLGKLANGVSFEILGIGENPAKNRPWWTADGSLISRPSFPEFDNRTEAHLSRHLLREFVVHISPPQIRNGGGPHVHWDVVGRTGRHVNIDGDGPAPESGLDGAVFDLPAAQAPFTVRADVAAGNWIPKFVVAGAGNESVSRAGEPGLPKMIFSCGPAISENGKTRLTFNYSGVGSKDEEVRLVAMDGADQEYTPQSQTARGINGAIRADYTFDLPAASITHWALETRRFDPWIEIRHIAAQPGANTQVQIVTSDDEPPKADTTQPTAAAPRP
jgi:RNA polymerase sigma factor (sigma-70 family)